jgi:hypothetical protein
MRSLAAIFSLLALTACGSVSQPITAISERGEIYRGTATASFTEGGSFILSRGDIRCSGSYDALSQSPTLSFPIVCTDGRKGLGTAIRETNGVSGSGTIRMSDGEDWTFVFGPNAALM